MENGDIEGADDGLPVPAPPNGRRYRPVGSDDSAVIQMTSMEPGSSAAAADVVTPQPPRNLNPGANLTINPSMREGSDDHATSSGPQRDSKLELFGFDSLVNILGLKSMTGEQIQAPSSPRDGEDVAITIGRPKETGPKFGTMMGVFVPCLQNILGIIYYIRFTWIVGMAGVWQSLVLVSFCGACTFLTGLSLSAIATNGAMKGGGPYYLIGRALGPEVGVSIGLCFFLGNAVAGSIAALVELLAKPLVGATAASTSSPPTVMPPPMVAQPSAAAAMQPAMAIWLPPAATALLHPTEPKTELFTAMSSSSTTTKMPPTTADLVVVPWLRVAASLLRRAAVLRSNAATMETLLVASATTSTTTWSRNPYKWLKWGYEGQQPWPPPSSSRTSCMSRRGEMLWAVHTYMDKNRIRKLLVS